MVRVKLDTRRGTGLQTMAGACMDYANKATLAKLQAVAESVGLEYSAAFKVALGSVNKAPAFASALDAAGFAVHPTDNLRVALRDVANRIQTRLDGYRKTAEALEGDLRPGLKLYPFQRDGVGWIHGRSKAALFDSMGLGKTITVLVAAPRDLPLVVVCPKNAKPVWEREARIWRPNLEAVQLQGRGSFAWPEPGQMVVTNYEILPEKIDPPPYPVLIVADEAHRLKSKKAQRTRRFIAVRRAALAGGGRVWVLTGTPLLNLKPLELWNVLEAADLGELAFGGVDAFGKLFRKRGKRIDVDAVVPKLLRRVSLMRLREDVLPELPTKTYRQIPCEIDSGTRQELDDIVEKLKAKGLDLESDRFVEAMLSADDSREGDLQEAYASVRKNLALAKLPTLVELVEDHESQGEPLVAFSCHREPIEILGARHGWRRIMGNVSQKDRQSAEEDFQAGKLAGLALTIQAGAEAITLTRGHSVAFADLWWTPALNSQAEDRVCRIGQSRGVIVSHLVAEHILDERVTELLEAKQQLIDDTVTASAVEEVSTDQDAVVLSFRELADRPPPEPVKANPRIAATFEAREVLGTAIASEGIPALLGSTYMSAKDRYFLLSLLGQLKRFRGLLTIKQWRALVSVARRLQKGV